MHGGDDGLIEDAKVGAAPYAVTATASVFRFCCPRSKTSLPGFASAQRFPLNEWTIAVVSTVPRRIMCRGSGYVHKGRTEMSLGMLLLIILILALVGVIPNWRYSTGWGYGPSGVLGVVGVVVLLLLFTGHI